MATNTSNGLHRSGGAGLNFDDTGFLVGQRRLEQGVKSVAENTYEILELLKAQLKARELNPAEHQLSAFQKAIIEANRQTIIDTTTVLARQQRSNPRTAPQKPTRDTDQQGSTSNQPAGSNSIISRRPTVDVQSPADVPKRQGSDISNTNQSNPAREQRTRDAKGRFIGEGGENGTGSDSNWLERVKNSIQSGVKDGLHTDVRGVDPTVDAINELGTLLSPVGKAASFTLRPLNAMLRGRKRNEPLPREEAQHNREQIRLLRRIADQNGNSAGMGAGMGKVAIGMISAVARRFPVIAAALGGIEAGKSFNEKLSQSEEGREALDTVGDTAARIAAAAGNKDAQQAVSAADKADDSARYKDRKENPAWFSNDGVYRFARKLGLKNYYREDLPETQRQAGDYIVNQKALRLRGFNVDKAKRIAEVAGNTGIDPNDLASIISFETAGSFSASKKNNKTSATGLIQFMRGSGGTPGKYFGMSREKFAGLSFDEQMKYVERYFKERGFDGKKKRSLADAYTAVTGYGYKAGSKEYELNKVWDTNRDGYISKGEAVKNPKFKEHQRQYFDLKKSEARQAQNSLSLKDMAEKSGLNNLSYNRLNINPAKPTQKAAVIPLKPTNTRSAPQLTPLAPVPSVKESLTSKQPQIVQLASSSDNIGQNVADRDIAHSVTGGLGARNWDA